MRASRAASSDHGAVPDVGTRLAGVSSLILGDPVRPMRFQQCAFVQSARRTRRLDAIAKWYVSPRVSPALESCRDPRGHQRLRQSSRMTGTASPRSNATNISVAVRAVTGANE
jgi:hypothetical protein